MADELNICLSDFKPNVIATYPWYKSSIGRQFSLIDYLAIVILWYKWLRTLKIDNDLINYCPSGKLAYRLKNEGAKVRIFIYSLSFLQWIGLKYVRKTGYIQVWSELPCCLKLCQVLMAAGDTFRAAACDQLEIWAERTGCEIVVAEKEKAKASAGRQLQ